MAIPVNMPKMSDTMIEGVLVAWLAEEGQAVSAGDVIAQVETDKATMDLEVYDAGVLLKRVVQAGDAVPIGALIAVLGKAGEDISAITGAKSPAIPAVEPVEDAAVAAVEGSATEAAVDAGLVNAPVEVPAVADAAVVTGAAPAPPSPLPAILPEEPGEGDEGRVKASPLARRLAQEHGIALGGVRGSGPEGRVIKRDIEAVVAGAAPAPGPVETAAAPAAPAPAPAATPAPTPSPVPVRAPEAASATPAGDYEAIRLSQMRKAIARRLVESTVGAPHFYLTVDVDMDKATAFRSQINTLAETQGRARVSFNDLITKACASALRRHPWANASWMEAEGEIRLHRDIHIAVAVAMDEGLITPVIRHTDRKGLSQIAEETKALADRARARQLQPDEFMGSTFTTSNLGMFGIEEFTAIINPPNACILAIGAIRDVPVVRGGVVVPGKRMKLSLSCDHRVVDGATGAPFIMEIKTLLEEPLGLVL